MAKCDILYIKPSESLLHQIRLVDLTLRELKKYQEEDDLKVYVSDFGLQFTLIAQEWEERKYEANQALLNDDFSTFGEHYENVTEFLKSIWNRDLFYEFSRFLEIRKITNCSQFMDEDRISITEYFDVYRKNIKNVERNLVEKSKKESQEEIQKLLEELKAKDQQIEALKNESKQTVDELEAKLDEASKILEDMIQKSKSEEERANGLQQTLQSTQEESNRKTEEINNLQSQLQEFNTIKDQNTQKDQQINDLNNQITALNGQIVPLQQSITDLQNAAQLKDDEIAQLKAQPAPADPNANPAAPQAAS